MRRIFFWFALLILALFIAAGCGGKNVSPGSQPEPEPAPDGKKLVETRCVRCHNLSQATRAQSREKWPETVQQMIQKSPGLLTESETAAVVLYLQENHSR